MIQEKEKITKILNSLKKLEKKLKAIPSNFDIKEEKLKNLKNSLKTAKNWDLSLLKIETEENIIYNLPYTSKVAKALIECFYTFEAKHSFEGLKSGLKISQITHHAFCNVPVVAKAFKNTERRTDKILFYPATKLETEKEYTFLKLKDKKDKILIEIAKVYQDIALKNLLLYKIEKIEIKKDLVTIPNNLEELDLATIKAQALAISKEESKNKVPMKERTAIYRENHPVDSYELLTDSRIIKNKDKIYAELVTEEGEVLKYDFLFRERPVAFTIFGIGFEKEIGWFPAAMIVNIFKRKDVLSKKSSPEEYLEKHTYHLNGKKLQANYKNLYLKGIYGLDKIPSLWSYASLTANKGKLNITIPIPIQRKMYSKENNEFKWQRTKPSSIAKAVYQILGTEKIIYKGEEIYLPGKRMFIEKELINIKEPSWLEEGLNLIKVSVNAYKVLQALKRGLDKIDSTIEDKEELTEYLKVKEIKTENKKGKG